VGWVKRCALFKCQFIVTSFTHKDIAGLTYWPNQGTLTEGEDQYYGPPCTNLFRPAAFDIAKIIYFFQISYLNEEVNCTEPSPSVSVLWPNYSRETHLFNQDKFQLIRCPWIRGDIIDIYEK
jgi:hypothetical protein